MSRIAAAVAVLVSSLVVPAVAAAAEGSAGAPSGAYVHDGAYFRFGGGGEGTWLTQSGPAGGWISGGGPSDTLLVGGTPWKGFVLGGGIHGSSVAAHPFPQGDVFGWTAMAGPFVDWYPNPKRGWHIGALAGVALLDLHDGASSTMNAVPAVTVFGGHDWWILPEWSLGLGLTASAFGGSASVVDDGVRYALAPLSFGLACSMTFH